MGNSNSKRGKLPSRNGRSRRRGSLECWWSKWISGVMRVFQEVSSSQEFSKGILRLPVCSLEKRLSCQDNHVPSGDNGRDQRSQRFADSAFDAIAVDGVAKRATCGYSEARVPEFIRVSNQHDKRVRIRFSHSPHPLEVT